MPRHWGFRADSRAEVGRGHVSRARAVAETLGAPVAFYLDPGPGADAPPGIAEIREARAAGCGRLLADLRAGQIGAALFDGYDFDEDDIGAARELGPVVRLDDFGAVRNADLVVNPTVCATAAPYAADGIRALCGTEYAPLGSGFAGANARARQAPARPASGVLVSFGARDSRNDTKAALAALARLERRMRVTAVLGAGAPHVAEIEATIGAMRDARLAVDVDDMIALYEDADLAVGAGGVSLLERMCCGVPSIAVVAAENQHGNIAGAARAGAVVALEPGDSAPEKLAAEIAALLDDGARREALRQAGLHLVDGGGAARIAAAMNELRS